MTAPEGQSAWRPGVQPQRRDAAGKLVTRLSILATVVAAFLFGMYWGFWRLNGVFTAKALNGTNNDHRSYFEQIYQTSLWGSLCGVVGSLVVAFAVGLAADGVRKAAPERNVVARYALAAAALVALGYVAVWGFQLASAMITE
ncbi:hypothetical protein DE4585_04929 [Mycobacteroides salmoniphilum]|uniref:Uncharacterized protein n=1 Tax=Mycobacteroides salmoniphilum TaxID=404941 RepID=A0A4R8RU61_9MYCO|nr:hypothetical protein [Mycobacteroides salmoniphilum]TDZ77534.1 hypothetical protein DE4585_04929 [Mycobacteroides salmoniphilum]